MATNEIKERKLERGQKEQEQLDVTTKTDVAGGRRTAMLSLAGHMAYGVLSFLVQ